MIVVKNQFIYAANGTVATLECEVSENKTFSMKTNVTVWKTTYLSRFAATAQATVDYETMVQFLRSLA